MSSPTQADIDRFLLEESLKRRQAFKAERVVMTVTKEHENDSFLTASGQVLTGKEINEQQQIEGPYVNLSFRPS